METSVEGLAKFSTHSIGLPEVMQKRQPFVSERFRKGDETHCEKKAGQNI